MLIRREIPGDVQAIRALVYAAFLGHAQHAPDALPTEHKIVDALRDGNELALSLVAEENGEIVGHIAFSPVLIGGEFAGWYGLGPLAVTKSRQRRGIGGALVKEGIERLRENGGRGVVLVGEPEYYGRFGFNADARLTYEGIPAEYFLICPFDEAVPQGTVTYSKAFEVT